MIYNFYGVNWKCMIYHATWRRHIIFTCITHGASCRWQCAQRGGGSASGTRYAHTSRVEVKSYLANTLVGSEGVSTGWLESTHCRSLKTLVDIWADCSGADKTGPTVTSETEHPSDSYFLAPQRYLKNRIQITSTRNKVDLPKVSRQVAYDEQSWVPVAHSLTMW